jgi:hypothetical protein
MREAFEKRQLRATHSVETSRKQFPNSVDNINLPKVKSKKMANGGRWSLASRKGAHRAATYPILKVCIPIGEGKYSPYKLQV